MARDILKAKFAMQGYDLRDDNCLYQKDTLVAKEVNIVEDSTNCIAFEFDLVPSLSVNQELRGKSNLPMYDDAWLQELNVKPKARVYH